MYTIFGVTFVEFEEEISSFGGSSIAQIKMHLPIHIAGGLSSGLIQIEYLSETTRPIKLIQKKHLTFSLHRWGSAIVAEYIALAVFGT